MKIFSGAGKGGAQKLPLGGEVLGGVNESSAQLNSVNVNLALVRGLLTEIRDLLKEQTKETKELKTHTFDLCQETKELKAHTREARDAVRADTDDRKRARGEEPGPSEGSASGDRSR